jgi:short-subunit dehydrogenase
MNNLKGKVVIITGASSGIGLACCKAFSKKGAKVVLAARSLEVITNLAKDLNSKGYETLAVQTDVTIEEDCKRLIDETVREFGQIDVLVNNAGISMRAIFAKTELGVLKRLMDVNFWGAVYCTKYALPYLLDSKGSVVGISSVAGVHGLPGRSGYSSSKYALQGFLDTLRVENMKNGLHVMTVIPGFVATEVRKNALLADGTSHGKTMRDEGKMMTADKLANSIVKGVEKRIRQFSSSYQGRFTPILKILFPRWVDRMFYNHMNKEDESPLEG